MSCPNDVLYFPKEERVYNVTGWTGFILFTSTTSEDRPRIASIKHCKRKRGVFHEFLIIEFEYPVPGAPPRIVPIIVERTIETSELPKDKIRLGADLSHENGGRFSTLFQPLSSSRHSLSPSSVASSSSSSLATPAFDRIIVPPKGARVGKIDRHARRPYRICRRLTFDKRFTDYDLAALLLALQEYAPDYKVLSRQCYWYSTVIYDFFRERLIGNEGGEEKEFNVGKLRDELGHFLTIFNIQPPEPPLGEIKSEFEKQLAALLDERAREDHPAAKWVRSQEETRAAIARAEEEAAARERAEAVAKEEAAARVEAEAVAKAAEATAEAAEAAAKAADARAAAAEAVAETEAAVATAAAAAAKAADARAAAAEAAAEAEAAARALLDDEVALLRQQLAALNHASPSPAA